MAQRKLQAEIDRTLKTVDIGVEVFVDTFDKLGKANNATQKDKLENDLKTQIKKLQRNRDQIKAWLGNNDIKDKNPLLERRKMIEQQMERFKALEKEMKMKAFSKEGLIAQSRLDPAEKAKRDMVDWINNTVDELSRQIEQTEAEMEGLQTTGKKKKQAGDRLGEMEELNERRLWHNGRLEVVQRMLENGQLTVDQVETIREDVNYFVEANTEEDFDYDVGIYDELNLQDEDEYLQDYAHNDDLSNLDDSSALDISESLTTPAPKTPAKEDKEKKSTPASKTATTPGLEEPPSPVQGKKQLSRKSTMDSTKAEPMKIVGKSEPVPPVPALPTPTSKASLPPIRYAAAVAGSAAAASSPGVATALSPTAEAAASPLKSKGDSGSALIVESPAVEDRSDPLQEQPEDQVPNRSSPTKREPVSQANGHSQPPPPPPGLAATSPAPPVTSQPGPSPQPPVEAPAQQQPQSQQPTQPYTQQAESSRSAAYVASPRHPPGVMGNLMQSFEMAKELSERRAGDINELHAALDGSFANAPLQSDSEAPRHYRPRNPIKTPSYYPQTKLPTLQDKKTYASLELDQLFYIFYYMTGTYEQWAAAEELKRQSWRFHKQYLTWFQRAHNPQAITEDYEQGGYFYFDWENSWCQRKKSDFRFEYRWLSDH